MPCGNAWTSVPEDSPAARPADNPPVAAFAYVDASLRGETGHQANACRQIVGELRRRDHGVDVFGSRRIDATLRAELGAKPCFRLLPYEQSLSFGAIDAALQEVSFRQDLARCWDPRRHRFVYFNSVLAPQLAAIGGWLERLPAGCKPRVAVEFGAPSGASSGGWFARFAEQYRRAALRFGPGARRHLLLFSFDSAASAEYEELLKMPVAVLPPVHRARGPVRRRRRLADAGLTLAFLGQQRTEKGLDLLPTLIRCLLASDTDIRILVQDGDVAERPATRELRALADAEPRVDFIQAPADPLRWQELLDRTDLMVLPYEPARYQASYSAVAVECVGAGIPMVVPAGSTMARLALEYQASANCFETWTVDSICRAILHTLADYESIAAAAFAGVDGWNRRNGPSAFADRLQAFAGSAPAGALDGAPAGAPPLLATLAVDGLLALREVAKRSVHALHGPDRNSP